LQKHSKGREITPSIREIQKAFAFGSTRSAFDYVKVLAKKDILQRETSHWRARFRILNPAAPPAKSTP
jgi:SOS-response transcriptional repressor LexA